MKIKICPDCKGKGTYDIDVGTHSSDYETKDCIRCNKTGRIIETEINLIAEIPFDKDCSKLYSYDTLVITESRKIKKQLNIE